MKSTTTTTSTGASRLPLVLVSVLVLPLLSLVPQVPAARAAVPTGFSEVVAFGGLVQPTAVRFAPVPAEGRVAVFVAEKRGTIQMFDDLSDQTPVQVADLRTEVHNFWDRGLLGLEVDPGFPARPYLYVTYTFDGVIGGPAPRWGKAGVDSDPCPDPPGATTDGCVVSGKLAKLTLNGTTTTKQDLIHEWCQQYPSHSVGDVVFDGGALYVSGGDGASFDFADYGQRGNPCGDPGADTTGQMRPPSAEGGALRAQDIRTATDPAGLNGTVVRVSPDTGAALGDNPAAGSSDPNVRRIVAQGLRNPFRMAVRPGTGEVWLGDVGWSLYEEINRVVTPKSSVPNFGWPCFEGNDRQPSYDAADLKICEDLYAQRKSDTKPYYAYRHGATLNSNDNCSTTRGSSAAGLSFQFYSGGSYPAEYDGALFFADYSRNCIWVMTKGTDGLPDRLKAKPFVSGAAGPVDVQLSPSGELYYVDIGGGTVRRVVYGTPPPAPACAVGQYRAEYFSNKTLTGPPASTLCEGAPLDHDWGTGAPSGVGPDNFSARWTGSFDFPTASTYTFTAVTDDGMRVWVDGSLLIDQWRDQAPTTYAAPLLLSAGQHEVKVEWFETGGGAVAKLQWSGGSSNTPPTPSITSPESGTTWKVGDTIDFAGSATDPEDGPLPASALSWEVVLQHCPLDCHAHVLTNMVGVPSGSFPAVDHEFPAHLELKLSARDSGGSTTTVVRRLDPQTAAVTVTTEPAGLQATLGSRSAVTPFTSSLIVGASTAVSAPSPQTLSGTSYDWVRWSDGGAATHDVVVGQSPVTYTATYSSGAGPAPACPAGQFLAEHYGNRTLSGSLASSSCEPAPLHRNWGSSGPQGAGHNNFSSRYTGTLDLLGGPTAFTLSGDDGTRLWVDGTLVIDQWSGAASSSRTVDLPAGTHHVRVEHFDRSGTAHVQLTWAPR